MRFSAAVVSIIFLLLSLSSGANDLDDLKAEIEEFHRQHPIENKEHYKWEVGLGGTEYTDISLSFKNRLLAYSDQVSALDKDIQSKIKTKDDLARWKWQLDEFDIEYESILNQMQILVDHIVAHTYNVGSLTGELLLYCEDTADLYGEVNVAMDKFAHMEYLIEARERNPHAFLGSGEWTKYLSEKSSYPSKGLKCENVIFNAEHMIRQAKKL